MILTGLARLGRNAEVRRTAGGEPVANLALAFNFGRAGADGKRPTQWIEAQLWGQRAEKLAPHLTKGTALDVVLEDPHIETYQGQNGQGHKLVARVVMLEFAGGGQQQSEQRQQSPQGQRQQQSSDHGYGDWDDPNAPAY